MTDRARLVLELLKENHSVDEVQSILKLNNREFSDALKYLKDYGFNFTKTFYSDGKVVINIIGNSVSFLFPVYLVPRLIFF